MSLRKKPLDIGRWGNQTIAPGESKDVDLVVAQSYSGMSVKIPVHVRRGKEPGPTLFVTAAVHGDEINGAGAIRSLVMDEELIVKRGSLLLVPVVNVLAFERHSRYLPDRRDLNRCFPGTLKGSLASRMARVLFDEIVGRCDYGIDLHTASVRRTNFPNVRGSIREPQIAKLAEAFGCEVIVAGKGPVGSFRGAACKAGCKTIMLEAGEVWKAEPAVMEYAVRGVKNVLIELGMIEGERVDPAYQTVVDKTSWVRADYPGFLEFHVAPGDLVKAGDAVATTSSLLGQQAHVIETPHTGIVIGMTTLPVTAPGEPVCHIGVMDSGSRKVRRVVDELDAEDLHERMRGDLATNIAVVEPEEESVEETESKK